MPIPTPPMQLNSVPNSPQSLDQTQNPILQNFVGINNAFYFNHVQYNDGSGFQGKHTYVQMPVQTVTSGPPQSPGYPFVSTDTALYSATSLVTGKSELVFVRGAGTPISTVPQTFEMSSYGTGSYTYTASGQGSISYNYVWTRFPSGLLFLSGTQTTTGPNIPSAGLLVNYPPVNTSTTTDSFPGFLAAVYNIQLTEQWIVSGFGLNSPIAVVPGSITTTGFRFTIAQNGNWPTNGSFSFSALGI